MRAMKPTGCSNRRSHDRTACHGLADGGQKLDSQALAPQLVASDLIDQLFVGVFVVADRLHQPPRLARIAWILASASA